MPKQVIIAWKVFKGVQNLMNADQPMDMNTEYSWINMLSGLERQAQVYDKDGRLLKDRDLQELLLAQQQKKQSGEPVENDLFYLQSREDETEMYSLEVTYDRSIPQLSMNETPLTEQERTEVLERPEKAKEAALEEASAEAPKEEEPDPVQEELKEIRAGIAKRDSAPARLFAAWRSVEEFKKTPGTEKRGMGILDVMKLGKSLEGVQELADVYDADGNRLEGDAWNAHLTARQEACEKGKTLPRDTFYLRCKDDISKMFKVTVQYGKTKPKLTLDKDGLLDDEKRELLNGWKNARNATAQKAAAQAEAPADEKENSPEKQAQKEKAAAAVDSISSEFVAVEDEEIKEAQKAAEEAKKGPEGAKPSMKEMEKEARSSSAPSEPSWRRYDVNAQKSTSGVEIEMAELEPLADESEKEPEKEEKLSEKIRHMSVEERDLSHIDIRLDATLGAELAETSAADVGREMEIAKNFRRDVMDAARENDAVRSLLSNMEVSSMQALYAVYRGDMQSGVDPQLKGLLTKTVEMAAPPERSWDGELVEAAELDEIENDVEMIEMDDLSEIQQPQTM